MRGASLVVGVLLLSACGGGGGSGGGGRVSDVPRTLDFDLTTPPDRAELGFEEGKRALVLGRDGGELRTVSIALPGGEQLRTDRAFRVDASALGPDGPPESLYVYTRLPADQVEQALRSPVLDLPDDQVADGLAVLTSQAATVSRIRDLKAPGRGYLTVGVGVSRDADQEDATVIYQLFWAETARAGTVAPSAGAPAG